MSPEALKWIKVGHIFGFLMWTGSFIGAINIMRAHAEAKAGAAYHKLEKSVGIAMDVGATLTIIFGLLMLFLPAGAPGIFMKGQGYFHAKLAAVVLLIALHVMARIKLKKMRGGDETPPPVWQFVATEVLVLAIIILVVVKPF